MEVKYFTCDHCGNKLTDMNDYIASDVYGLGLYKQFDLCAKCKEELCEYIHAFVNAAKEAESDKR